MNIDFYIPRAERRFDNWGYFEYAKEKYYTYFKFFFKFLYKLSF